MAQTNAPTSWVDTLQDILDDLGTRMPVHGTAFFPREYGDVDDSQAVDWDESGGFTADGGPSDSVLDSLPSVYFCPGASGPIVAVDGGLVSLGETDDGVFVAVRVYVLVRDQDVFASHAVRTGVLFLPRSADGKKEVLHAIGAAMGDPAFYVRMDRSDPSRPRPTALKLGTDRDAHYVDRLRSLIERLAQFSAVSMVEDGTVLIDGALTLRSHDTPDSFLKQLARKASQHGNSLIAISKRSELLVEGRAVRFWLSDIPRVACYRDLTPALQFQAAHDKRAERVLGTVYAMRFSPLGPTFRVDVHPAAGMSEAEAINQLYSSAPLHYGYPDILVQAHALCCFSRADLLTLQAQVCARYRLVPKHALPLSHIFAPFGGRYK